MPAATDQLEVWMNGFHVGTWSVSAGVHRFEYDPDWIGSRHARALSLSLPFVPGNLAHRGEVVENYFDNLLPDSADIRRRLQSKFGRRSMETFDLLSAIGRECVGAVQLLPPETVPADPQMVQAVPLDDRGVQWNLIAASSEEPFGGADGDDFRISIAGAQEKTALLWYRKRWHKPRGSTPTTHILKLPLGLVGNLQADMKDSVENEWLCAQLLAGFGIPVANCAIAAFGSRKVLVVERFDRAWQEGRWIARLPQEDFCQAMGVPGSRKYEKQGGPGMKDILRLLASSANPDDSRTFVKAQLLFWALAATDGHGKNFSLFHLPGGSYRMTPLYDVLSAWPIIGRSVRQLSYQKAELAMAIHAKNTHYKLEGIRRRHWDDVARLAGSTNAGKIVDEVVAAAPTVLESVEAGLPTGFPAQVAEKIFQGFRSSLRRLVE